MSIVHDADGRPILSGASTLPPMNAKQKNANSYTGDKTAKQNGQALHSLHKKQVSASRFGVLNAFVDCSMGGLSKAELATWLCLYRDTKNGTARTSQTDIAKRAGLSVRAVKYAMGKLIKAGLLVCVYKGGLNRGPSRYRVASLVKLIAPVQGQKPVRHW